VARSREACINHPQKFTARKCYYCKAAVCSQCQYTRFHHIFCGPRHAWLWRAGDLWQRYKPTRELLWLGAFILLSNIILYYFMAPESNSSASPPPGVSFADSVYDPRTETPSMDSVRLDLGRKLLLSVNGLRNGSVNLVINGKLTYASSADGDLPALVLNDGANHVALWTLNAAGQSSLLDSFTIHYSSARLRRLSRAIYYFKTSEKAVALTFDGGSSNKGTEQILDILKENHIRCTMFLTGRFMEHYPELVRRILRDGHEIGNHTYNHPHFTNLEIDGTNKTRASMTEARFKNQLLRTDSIFSRRFGGKLKPYWRAPFGEINPRILRWAAETGFRHIGWSARCDSWDWVRDPSSSLYRSAAEIRDHFLKLEAQKGLEGKIILMHLGSEREKDFPYESLDSLIRELKKRGYRFVTVSAFMKPVS